MCSLFGITSSTTAPIVVSGCFAIAFPNLAALREADEKLVAGKIVFINQPMFRDREGAGYAGGILSAGVDGIKVAEAVIAELTT